MTNPEEWRHVPGDKNAADLPTRGVTASQLNSSQTWQEGPEFLLNDESTWPQKQSVVDPGTQSVDEERGKKHITRRPAIRTQLPSNFLILANTPA